MKKSMKTLCILVLALLVIIGGGIIYKAVSERIAADKEAESQAESAANVIKLFEGSSIVKAQIDDFAFDYNTDDATWTYEGDETFPVSKSTVETVATGAMDLVADRVLTGGDTLENYGLAEPTHTIVLEEKDGKSTTFAIGNTTTDGTYYVMKNGDESEIYTCALSFTDYFSDDLMDFAAIEDLSGIWSDSATSITLTFGDKTYTATDSETISTWSSTIGFNFTTMIDYQVTDEDKETYGLAEPCATVTILYTDDDGKEQEFDLWFGDDYSTTHKVFMSSNSNYMYLVTISNYDSIETLLTDALGEEEETTTAE